MKTGCRKMALDVGDARIGVAVSDESGLIARPVAIITRREGHPVEHVADLVEEHEISEVIVGLPRNMDGTLGIQAEKSKTFAARLRRHRPEVSIVFWDERLSSE